MSPENTHVLDISFVIPARDEEALIAQTLMQITESANQCALTYEIIVVDDGSTDATADIAKSLGANVVFVSLHNIGAVRNAGAKVATGTVIFFLDADTLLPEKTLQAAMNAVSTGALGGGASVAFEPGMSLFQRVLAGLFAFMWQRVFKWAAGCSIFVRRDVFEEFGGFDPQYFAAEERYLSNEIKARGKFVILREPVITSARKLRLYSTWHLIKVGFKALLLGEDKLKRCEGLEILYDAPREKPQP